MLKQITVNAVNPLVDAAFNSFGITGGAVSDPLLRAFERYALEIAEEAVDDLDVEPHERARPIANAKKAWEEVVSKCK